MESLQDRALIYVLHFWYLFGKLLFPNSYIVFLCYLIAPILHTKLAEKTIFKRKGQVPSLLYFPF